MNYLSIILFAVCVFLPHPAGAHVLETDGSVGASLHITPDDDPTVGKPAVLNFAFSDREGKFSLPTCTCTIRILEAGNELLAQPLINQTVAFTFPRRNIYTIQVHAESPTKSFPQFTLSYDLRVTRGAGGDVSDLPSWAIVSLTLIGFLIALLVVKVFRMPVK